MEKKWALVLGASSGFGGAAALEFAKAGYNILGIHLDRQSTMPNVEKLQKKIQKLGMRAEFFNMNAADPIKRNDILDEIKESHEAKNDHKIHVIIHSLAFGTLKPFITKNANDCISKQQMEMTMDVMAHSLVYWTQGLVQRNLLANGSKIFALTSAGSQTVIYSYGAVSAAKAALEAHIRQLAVELGHLGVSANAIMAGVTDTPALRKIPRSEKMLSSATAKNPRGKLTNAEEVAKAIVSLAGENCQWISGNVIAVDGGEYIVSYTGDKVCQPIK